MRSLSPFVLLVLVTVATTAAAENKSPGPVSHENHPPGPAVQLPGHITDAKLAPNWYNAANRTASFQVGGTGPDCGAQALFKRKEDSEVVAIPFGVLKLPWQGGGLFTNPHGLLPGTYDVVVNGAAVGSPASAGCGGSVHVGTIVADEALLGKNFPKITGSKWVGATANGMGVYKSGEDKFLDVNIVNYLDGSKFTTPTPTMNPVCALTISAEYAIVDSTGTLRPMNVHWNSPYPLVLAPPPGQKPGTRDQVITPGPGGATFKANITQVIKAYQTPSKGEIWTITVASTFWNNGQGEAACIGTTTAKFKVE